MRAVAGSLGIGPLDLPWAEGPRLSRAEDIEAHLPLFKDHAAEAGLLAKAGSWDESSARGGWFNHGEGGVAAEDRSVSSDNGGNSEPPSEIPKERPRTREVAGQDMSCISILRTLTFTQAGLALGRGTLLAEFGKEGLAACGLALDGNEARVLSLLAAAFAAPVAPHVIKKMRHAGEIWHSGDKALAQIHLAFMGLPEIGEIEADRLFLAEIALNKGLSPSDLMKALGFPRAASDLEKYREDQPRVPAGSGRESGQWTSGDGPRQQYAQVTEPPPPIQRIHPDETYETDQKAKRSLEYWRQQSTEEIIQSLEPRVGNKEALTVKPDGTVVQGNTRTKVLEERGVDVNSLPRAPFDDSIEMFLPQIRTPGGGSGPIKDKKYPIQE